MYSRTRVSHYAAPVEKKFFAAGEEGVLSRRFLVNPSLILIACRLNPEAAPSFKSMRS
jgi:hypothetical protein